MQRKVFIMLLVAVLLCLNIFPVLANTIDEKKQELDKINQNIQQRKKELAQNKQEQEKILREIKLLEKEIAVVEAEIRSLNNKITDTENKIAQAEADLQEAEENMAKMDEILSVRLRAIHEHGQVNYLEVLFNSTSFADFLSRFHDLQQIIQQDKELLLQCKQERERIVALKADLEEHRQELLTLRRDSLNKRQEKELKHAQQKNLVAALQEAYEQTNREISKLEEKAAEVTEIIKRLQEQQKNTASRGTGTLTWPVPEYGRSWITSGYGYRRDPITGRQGVFHGGIDIGIPHSRWPGSASYKGNPVNIVAADAGIAYTYKMGSGYGNLVIVDHGGGVATVYGHTHSFLVANGQPVAQGQPIAIVGSTGYSTGPHLHFEVRINGQRVNPLSYLR
ncbi:MAG: peptidoglycan DD-metalloendopeptidase family protein [Firmicutes bacterium]|nr:peptidoglycan DD-metalloendopeptidase family protein [Bacillota bacterium]